MDLYVYIRLHTNDGIIIHPHADGICSNAKCLPSRIMTDINDAFTEKCLTQERHQDETLTVHRR
jgi:hypothetical protein